MILNFGKHKNLSMEEIPTTYLAWLAMFDLTDCGVSFLTEDDYSGFTKPQKFLWDRRKFFVIGARAEMKRRRICYDCLKRLVPVGRSRRFGADHDDWSSRRLHKKCWKELCC